MAELLADFEINKKPRWPRLLRLTSISFVLHALFFAAIIYVPVLREAFHIGSRFSDTEMVDEDYEKVNVREAVMIGGSEKFQYPPGYFNNDFNNPAPEIIPQPTPLPTPIPTPTPTPTPSPSPSPSPTPQTVGSPGTGDAAVAGATPQDGAETDLDKAAAQNKVKRPRTVNKRPFVDLLVKYNELKDKGEIDLNGPVEMTIEADRNEDGTLRNVIVIRKSGDEKLIQAAKDFIAALSASGALDFLEGTDHLVLTLKLDPAAISVSASTEAASDAEARQKALGYNTLLYLGAVARKGRDEATIMSNTKVTSNGKQITINFNLPRSAIGDMLKKQIPAG
jgi:hypothetical protein